VIESTSKRLALALCATVVLPMALAYADVSVVVGPTAIPRGNATGARDITISNGLFAVAFAVDTAPPWGVARGGIVDIALIRQGELDFDIASLADFMPNRWSSWPTTYQQVTLERHSAAEALVKTVRDWGAVELETMFRIQDGNRKIHMVTRMTNKGEAALTDLYSGYVVWPDGGSLFGMPGLHAASATTEEAALGGWSASYGEHWALGLHAPFSEIMAYGGRDRYLKHDLQPGSSRSFEAWLQIENDGTLAPLVAADIEFRQLSSGRLSGRVVDNDGKPVDRPAVVVLQGGVPYAWTTGADGGYAISLPTGDYEIYATAEGYAPGATQSVTVAADGQTHLDFDDVRPPGAVHFEVSKQASGHALDARISIREGHKSIIGYFGKNTFFTELDPVGELTASIAPGHYVFAVSAGGGFTSRPQLTGVDVAPGKTENVDIAIRVMAMPRERGWYGADLHHHSDVLDGFTEAEFVMRSELAAGVDIAFLSDHDSVVNNHEMQVLSAARGLDFIPGTEFSPSWAHFNAYPLDAGETVTIDTGQATVQEIFATARSMGADVIAANHPYSEYGYFESIDHDAVPGGYDPDFDVIEIEAGSRERNEKTLQRAWQLWNEGTRAYLTAGSDAHDVWLQESGSARVYTHVDGELTVDKYVAALKDGHAFASQGPLVYPERLFGTEVRHPAGAALALRYAVQAVTGLRSVELIERGERVATLSFDGSGEMTDVEFQEKPAADTWYSLVIEDTNGKFAYTNPLWVLTGD